MDNQSLDFTVADTGILRSPNVITDNHGNTKRILDDDINLSVPTTADVVEPTRNNTPKVRSKDVVQLLEMSAAANGVMVSDIMTNTVIAMAHKLNVDADSMDWFMAGITFANNSMMLEKMTSAIKDLQVEVRNIQLASKNVSNSSDELVSKIKANKHEIVKEMEKTRDAVLGALGSMSEKNNIEKEAPKTVIIGMSTGKKNQKKVAELAAVQPVNPALTSSSLSKPISTKSPEETVHEQKEKLLIDLGYDMDEVMSYDALTLEFIVTDDILAAASAGLTAEAKEVLLDMTLDNQIAYMQLTKAGV